MAQETANSRGLFEKRKPVREIDVSIAGLTDFTDVLDALSIDCGVYEFANIQFHDPAQDVGVLVAKYSLSEGYDLTANAGAKILNIAQLSVSKQEYEHFKMNIDGAGATVNAHITLYA